MPLVVPGVCNFPGCTKGVLAKHLCGKHYTRLMRYGDPNVRFSTKRHGMSNTPEFHAWVNAKRRCHNPRSQMYPHYGARGIEMCQEWRDSFEAFYQYVGPRPTNWHSLERIDNDGNYEPGNVRWATKSEQSINQRRKTYPTDDMKSIKQTSRGWMVLMRFQGKTVCMGTYDTVQDAARARDGARKIRAVYAALFKGDKQ